MQLASAGVGIKWSQESFSVDEGQKTCLVYSVYNPWPEDSYVAISLPESLKNVLVSQEAETKLVPANTPSSAAVPINFCFKAPQVYVKECLVGSFICKQECNEAQKTYEGEVSVNSVPSQTQISGSGGSSTQMSVSAPLKIIVKCNAYGYDFTLVYLAIAIICAIFIAIILYRKYRTPAAERDRAELKRLQERLRKERKK